MITFTRILPALAMACALASFTVEPAAAQTATKLKCKNCVTSKELKNGGIKGKDLKDNAVTGSKMAPNAVAAGFAPAPFARPVPLGLEPATRYGRWLASIRLGTDLLNH